MIIWETQDRQGIKHFSKRPTFLGGFSLFSGNHCRKPNKKDIVIRRFTALYSGPEIFKPKTLRRVMRRRKEEWCNHIIRWCGSKPWRSWWFKQEAAICGAWKFCPICGKKRPKEKFDEE